MMLKKITCFIMSCFLLSTLSLAIEFSDMENHWAKEAVDEMASREIITGYSDGTFKPNRQVTREEFATILVKTLKLEENTSATQGIIIEDVNPNRWSTPFIKTVWPYITKYKVKDKIYFYPAIASTREDMAVAIVKALRAKFPTKAEYDISKYSEDSEKLEAELSQFKDKNKISKNLKPYVAVAKNTGIINGYEDGTFRPDGKLTRAATASLMWNLLKALGEEEKVVDPFTPTVPSTPTTSTCEFTTTSYGNGQIIFSNETPTVGSTVTITFIPDSGYSVGYVQIDDMDVSNLLNSELVTDNKYNRTYTFTVTNEIHDVYVSFDETDEVLYGDINGDGIVNEYDASLLFNYSMLPEQYASEVIADVNIYGDVDINGMLDIRDSDIIKKYVEGIIYNLPHEHEIINGTCICGTIEEIIYGDVNVDGKVTTGDYGKILSYVSNKISDIPVKNADVDLDGKITDNDAWLVLMVCKKVDITLPHDCNSHTESYEKADEERHNKIETCKCGEISIKNSEAHSFVDGKCVCGTLESTNNAPVISSITTSDIKTDSFTIKATATDSNNDDLTYLVYISKNGNFDLLKTSSPIVSGKEFSYTVTDLSNYTDYSYYIEVNDGTTSTKSETYAQKTLCPGGTKFEVWCTGGSSKCSYDCTYSTCGNCPHTVHSGTCTVVTCTECDGTGYCKAKKGTTGTPALDPSKTCPLCGANNVWYQDITCNSCGAKGWGEGCRSCWNYTSGTSAHSAGITCPECNGKPTCGCTHNSMYCNKSSYTCSHGYVGGHYYSSTSQCSHGYTSQH